MIFDKLSKCHELIVLNWSSNSAISDAAANQATACPKPNIKFYDLVGTLSIQDNFINYCNNWNHVLKTAK